MVQALFMGGLNGFAWICGQVGCSLFSLHIIGFRYLRDIQLVFYLRAKITQRGTCETSQAEDCDNNASCARSDAHLDPRLFKALGGRPIDPFVT